jgi:hypothetical protein
MTGEVKAKQMGCEKQLDVSFKLSSPKFWRMEKSQMSFRIEFSLQNC